MAKEKKLEGLDAVEYFKGIFGPDYGEEYAKKAAKESIGDLALYDYYMSIFADEEYVKKLVEEIESEKSKEKKNAMITGFIKVAEAVPGQIPADKDVLLVEITSEVLPLIGASKVHESSVEIPDNSGKKVIWTIVKKDGKYYLARVIDPKVDGIYKERLQFETKRLV